MRDFFRLLDQPRALWLDAEKLKAKFIELSSQFHPDRVSRGSPEERRKATDDFSVLNAAFQCLREPRERLRHFLELEKQTTLSPVNEVPPEAAQHFFEVGDLLKKADRLLKERAGTRSPLVKVSLFEQALEMSGALRERAAQLQLDREKVYQELRAASDLWKGAPRDRMPWSRLEEIYRLLGYLDRWKLQLQERASQLSFPD